MPLCKNFQAYYVAGLGGSNAADFEDHVDRLGEGVFGLEYDDRIEILTNNANPVAAAVLDITDPKLEKKINDIAKRAAAEKCCDECVSLVWFGHSMGAKCVVNAYKKFGYNNTAQDVSCIVTIGGVSFASNQAQKVLNVVYRNDNVAWGAGHAMGDMANKDVYNIGPFEDGVCKCCSPGGTKPERGRSSSFQVPLFGYSVLASESSKNSSKSNSTSTSQSSANKAKCDERAHYIEEYMACKNWRREVKKLVGSVSCRCVSN